MAPAWMAWCVTRESKANGRWHHFGDCATRNSKNACVEILDGDLEFFDCAETLSELQALRSGCWLKQNDQHPYADSMKYSKPARENCTTGAAREDCTDAAVMVLERALAEWELHLSDLCAPEPQWATIGAARRMLKANIGDEQKAVDMLVQALEVRARDRELFQNLKCEPRSDIRIIARDLRNQPTVYMCARSMTESLSFIRDQFVVTFEAACNLTSEDGKVCFIIDMHGMNAHLLADIEAIKDLAGILGTVYAERISRITIVDFSYAAQAIWWMIKPLLSPVTKDKFAFVDRRAAIRGLCDQYDQRAFEDIEMSFALNRDQTSTVEERLLHARRTTLCDVPLGPPLK